MENNGRNTNMLLFFNMILQGITKSKDENELVHRMGKIGWTRYFEYGFGSDHLWVHQKNVGSDSSKVDEKVRVLIVDFSEQ